MTINQSYKALVMRCKALKFKKCLLQDEVSIGYVRETLHMLEYVVL